MKNYKGAVFFDVDGTLVDERLEIFKPTLKTIESIQKLKENGYLVGIATGRARCYVPDMGIDFDCYVSCNGAAAEVDGQEIFNDYIPEKDLLSLIDFMEKEGIGYDLESADACYVQEKAVERFQKFIEIFRIPFQECFSVLKDPRGLKINKILIAFDTLSQFEHMKEHLSGKYSVIRHHQHFSADVGKAHMSKATGIRAVIEKLNLDMKKTYAFGDDGNDVEMLTAVGCGIAMTPHAPELDKAANYVTCGVADDGIYHGLKHFDLI